MFILITLIGRNNQEDNIKKDDVIKYFYELYVKAKYYDNNYFFEYFQKNDEKELFSIFSNEESKIHFFYENNSPDGYSVFIADVGQAYFKIMMNPCKNYKEFCCDGMAICEEENTEIKAGGDLEFAFISNNFITVCENEFQNKDCGAFIEIHMPGNPKILNEFQIKNYSQDNFKSVLISSKNLCSGRYELWLVFRMRKRNFLNYVKPFFVKYPSCNCEYLKGLGLECK